MLDTVMSLRDYFRRVGRVCDSADPATDLVRVLLRPSRSAADALRATVLDVCLAFFALLIVFLWSALDAVVTASRWAGRARERELCDHNRE